MAILGRSDLLGESNSTFPTNNANQIEAVTHRGYNADMIESKFNLVDDEIQNVWWDKANNITLKDYLEDLNPVILRGFATVGDIGGGTNGLIVSGGDITSANKVNATGGSNASTVTFNFASVGTTDYVVILNILGSGSLDDDNSINGWVLRDKSSTSFKIDLEENAGSAQNFRYDVALIKTV